VAKAEVSLEQKSARVEYEAGRVTREDMKRAIVDAGFEAE
jgi:copper chaperone CopZ